MNNTYKVIQIMHAQFCSKLNEALDNKVIGTIKRDFIVYITI